MAVTPAELTAPVGEIEGSLFPGEAGATLTSRLQGYIDEGALKAPGNDEATKAWAYYRAFRAVYIRLSAEPNSATLNDEGSRSFGLEQVARFRTLSAEALKTFEGLTIEDVIKRPENTVSMKTGFTW